MSLISRVTVVLAISLFCCGAGLSEEKPANAPDVKFEIRRAESEPAEGLTEATVVGTTNKVYLHKETSLTNEDINEARVNTDNQKQPRIQITFTKEGGMKMAKLTKEHNNKPLAILVGGKVIAAPIVRAEISKFAVITGSFTKEEAEKIAKSIKSK
jgi:preprotein translocase subunit SecD